MPGFSFALPNKVSRRFNEPQAKHLARLHKTYARGNFNAKIGCDLLSEPMFEFCWFYFQLSLLK